RIQVSASWRDQADRRGDDSGHVITIHCFFFQAEDGIRDFHVTGVQTCALPICRSSGCCSNRLFGQRFAWRAPGRRPPTRQLLHRSEERRVGKECSCRWSAYHCKTEPTGLETTKPTSTPTLDTDQTQPAPDATRL